VATYEDFDRTVWAARRRATTPPTETQDRAPDDGDTGRERSADEVRDRMAAFQRGWQRGREIADAEPGSGDDSPAPSTSVPRTTPEGNGR